MRGSLSVSLRRKRRGAVFILALSLTVILSALLLVYSQEMRTEMTGAANRLAEAQADGVEQGAEQWVLAEIEANTTALPTTTTGGATGGTSGSSSSSSSSTVDPTTIPAEAIPVGTGYFWILKVDPTQDQIYTFGLTDESGKLNINSATATQLQYIPNMTTTLATSVTSFLASAVPSGTTLTASGVTAKLSFESVEELLLTDQNLTPQLLYGYDLNHDGVIDQNEQNAAGGAAITNGTTSDSRGMFNYLTVYSTTAQVGTTGTTAPTVVRGARGITQTPQTIGLINVNTAPLQVLECLPGLTQNDATTLINYRTSQTVTGTSWVAQALSQSKASAITPYITGVSYQYSADIVAVSGDARAFKRVRIVVDCRQQPAKIIYRKDLTSLGWPLPPEVRDSMRAGKGVPVSVTGTTNQETNNGPQQ